MKKAAGTLAKAAFTAGVMAWLLHKSDLHAIGQQLREAHLSSFLLLFLFVVIGNLGQVLRWQALVQNIAGRVSFFRLLQFHMIAIFFQSFLPSSMTVEIVKGWLLSRVTDAKKAYGSVLFGKFMGLFVLFVFFAGLLLLQPGLILGKGYSGKLALGMGLFLCMALVVFSKKVSRFLFARFEWLSNNRWFLKAKAFREEIYNYRYAPQAVAKAIIFSVIIFLGSIISTYFSFRAVNFPVPFTACMITIPVIYVLMMLPISINGIGLREGLLLLFLKPWNLTVDALISSSILAYAVIYTLCLLGGLVYLLSGIKGVQFGKEKKPA
ncbi:MAG: lysylphosphatidylglycerol synthase transmembrane domain-containing protein [Fibrobacterota bacterium]